MSASHTADALPHPAAAADDAPWLAGGGDMGARMRTLDWRPTPLGAVSQWPQSLRSAVSICLGSGFPMVVLWGPRLTMLYNDAYAPMLGNKHPWALGRDIHEVWHEVADVITPMMDSVMRTGVATWSPDSVLTLERHGAPEETYFSYSFGPVRIEDGSVGGILAVTVEMTERVVSERRLAFLSALSDRTAGATDPLDVCVRAMQEVGGGTPDLRQAAIYLREDGHGDRLVAQSDPPHSGSEAPQALPDPRSHPAPWGPHALAVPIRSTDLADPLGTLVVALNPLRPLDERYRTFVALVARQVARSINDVKTLQQERARVQAEQDLRRMFEQAPSFVCILKGPQHVFEFVNRAHLKLFNSAGWVGRPVREAFPDLADQGYYERLDEVYRTGERFIAASAPVRYRFSADQQEEERLLDFIFEPIRDDAGQVTGIFCEGFDVTAQRRAEAGLRQQEERLRAFIHSAANVIYSMSPDWSEMHTLDGRGFVADAQAHQRDWMEKYVHAEDHDRVRAAIQDAVQHRRPFELEHRVLARDGSVAWTASRAVPMLDAHGRICEWFGTASDITARKHMEEALDATRQQAEAQRRLYEAILTNTPDLAYVFDLSHRFIYANDVLLRMWGKTWDEAIGKTCLELGYEPWHAAMHDREIDRVVATGQPIRGEVPFAGAFGRRIYDYIFVPVLGQQGEVIAVAGTTRDITEMKTMEETLRSQADQLREGDQRKDEFLGMLAHELRNPLAPLRNGLEVIRRVPLPEGTPIPRVRAMMDRQVTQMVRLIDDLLDVTRISSGKIRISKARVALGAVLEAAVETSQPAIDQAGHTLTITSPSVPVFVDADATRLAQVFANLLNNAAKFTAKGGHLQITTLPGPDSVQIRVRDDGEGIPPEMLSRIFEMFVQVDRTLERDKSGLGIGLSLARGLVSLHGGRIEARSDGPGQGSEFIVELPLAVDVARPAPGAELPGELEELAARRVLIADDNIDAADSLAMLFELMGSEAKVVHNGMDAVHQAEQFQPDLVFLDIGMPGLNGYEACARIKATPWGRDMVLVALTGWGQDKDRLRAREAGFDGHLVKPVNPEAIKALISGFDRRP
ncbi:PAS domain-containing protein [Roseateles amylovorans]|uniref:histidine kinase n=1 Tax=Roseateles amylovorans TaxID=2978473 RepID=A0ABY6BC28_9BURK|nr:PAS domain-containing protein [Roseateles amylovorans]UXH80752.1 PAS domain-containing protein [Roseateles amylovorans]